MHDEIPDDEPEEPLPYAPPPLPPDTGWTITGALEFGWTTLTSNPIVIVAVIVGTVPGVLLGGVRGVLVSLTERARGAEAALLGAGIGFVGLLELVVGVYFAMVLTRYFIDTARGRSPDVGSLFTGGPYLSAFAASLIQMVAVLLGICALVVPGVILALGLSQTQALVVDGRLGPWDAIKRSWEITQGWKLRILGLWLVSILVALVGVMACVVGLVPAAAIIYAANAYTYLHIVGERPVRQR